MNLIQYHMMHRLWICVEQSVFAVRVHVSSPRATFNEDICHLQQNINDFSAVSLQGMLRGTMPAGQWPVCGKSTSPIRYMQPSMA
jgi:hypothetical protein